MPVLSTCTSSVTPVTPIPPVPPVPTLPASELVRCRISITVEVNFGEELFCSPASPYVHAQ